MISNDRAVGFQNTKGRKRTDIVMSRESTCGSRQTPKRLSVILFRQVPSKTRHVGGVIKTKNSSLRSMGNTSTRGASDFVSIRHGPEPMTADGRRLVTVASSSIGDSGAEALFCQAIEGMKPAAKLDGNVLRFPMRDNVSVWWTVQQSRIVARENERPHVFVCFVSLISLMASEDGWDAAANGLARLLRSHACSTCPFVLALHDVEAAEAHVREAGRPPWLVSAPMAHTRTAHPRGPRTHDSACRLLTLVSSCPILVSPSSHGSTWLRLQHARACRLRERGAWRVIGERARGGQQRGGA